MPRPGASSRPGAGRRPAALAAIALVAVAVATIALSEGNRATRTAPLPLASAASAGPLAAAPDPGPLGPELVPVPSAKQLAPAGAPPAGKVVDGISSAPLERLEFHVHAHLTIFVRGAARQIPYGIGIAPPIEQIQSSRGPFAAGGTRFAWIHTHAADGIVHIESPVARVYTLGDFFDIWGQPLTRDRVGPEMGVVTAFFDGQRYIGDPRTIPLVAHAQIQLDVGGPLIAPESIAFPAGL